MTLKQRVLRGVGWSTASRVAQQIAQLAIAVVMMRLLSPDDYGLIGMATVFIGFAALFSELGLSAAVVQRETLNELQLSSVFWLNMFLGILLSLVFFLLAPTLSMFFERPELQSIVQVLSVTFTITALALLPKTLLQKEMEFQRLAAVEVAALLVSAPTALFLAYQGWAVWALVAQQLVSATANMVGAWIAKPPAVQFRFSYKAVRDILGYGANL
ncbi:MAG: oligosaccharide flippase family protein, partial [Myxococcota bacterium]